MSKRRAPEPQPATQCECGTIRTPGITHTKGDVGPEQKPLLSEWCSK